MSKELFFKDSTVRQYVNGDLKGQVLIDFERELRTNDDLKTEVDLAAFLVANYNLNQKKRFRTLMPVDTIIEVPKEEDVVSFTEEVKTERTKVKPLMPNWIKLAAAAVVFLALGIGLFVMNNQPISTPQLAQTYLEEPYTAPVVSRGENSEEVWNQAIVAYKKGDYNQSATLIQKIIDKGEAKEIHRFYLGLSQLYKPNPVLEKAIEQFEEIKSGYYFDSAKWYESLVYLKLDNKEKAKSILESIKNSSRTNEVNKLLESIK